MYRRVSCFSKQEIVVWRLNYTDSRAESCVGEIMKLAKIEHPDAKACPFCRETGVTVREGSTFRWILVECNACGATCGEVRVQTTGTGTPDEWMKEAIIRAIAVWNTR